MSECPKHPEGGLRHEYIFCHCDVASAEKKGRDETKRLNMSDAIRFKKEGYAEGYRVAKNVFGNSPERDAKLKLDSWNEAIEAAGKVAGEYFIGFQSPHNIPKAIADKLKELRK